MKYIQWPCSGVFIANFEHISDLALVFLLLTLNMYMSTGLTDSKQSDPTETKTLGHSISLFRMDTCE